MSFPRYPAYRDSGVEWLGEIPCEWTVARFDKHAYTHRLSITPDQLDGQVVLHYSIPSIQETGRGAIEEGGSIDSSKLVINQPQLLVSKLNPHKQVVVLAKPHDELLTVSSTEFVPLVSITANSDYMRYAWQSSTCLDYLLARCDSATRSHQRVSPDDISKMLWAWPNKKDQSQIASFLDHETAKIDALVAEQERLIELLKEKRQAVISHAVTKGLDPSVPMKDSGVEWLGEVPAHWEVKRLKFVAHVQTGIAKGKDTTGKSTIKVPYLRVANVQDGYLALDDIATIDIEVDQLDRYRLRPGDVLMNEGGDYDKLGRGAIWSGDIQDCIHQNHVFAVRPHSVSPHWLNFITSSQYAQFYFMSRSKQSTNLASISSSNIMELPVVMPPEDEQSSIRSFIEGQIKEIDSLQVSCEHAITLLQERRTALISAAVTGQIDVRNLASFLPA